VTLSGRAPKFSSADGEVRSMQFSLWREGVDQPLGARAEHIGEAGESAGAASLMVKSKVVV
jgi:hypothetical protein